MDSRICDMLGIDFPLLAFSHCRDVVAEVSKAGGFGVLGAAGLSTEQLETELSWIDAHVDGKPYGLDLIVPNKFAGKGEALSEDAVLAALPQEHKDFVADLLRGRDVDLAGVDDATRREMLGFNRNITPEGTRAMLDVAFAHPIKLIANALGIPPQPMIEMGKAKGVAVAALVGAKSHALRQMQAGVDILIAAGGEAGGHCGSVSTMVLVPEICEAVAAQNGPPVLAAGGIVTGRQMAACMAMGAAGAWTGSVWLTTAEAETNPAVKEKMIAANSRQTVRSRSRTGKYTRQLRSAWTDAWQAPEAPDPLPMPLQSLVSEPALRAIDKLAESGDPGARNLATYWVGQGVGLMNSSQSVRSVVMDFMEDFAAAAERLSGILED